MQGTVSARSSGIIESTREAGLCSVPNMFDLTASNLPNAKRNMKLLLTKSMSYSAHVGSHLRVIRYALSFHNMGMSILIAPEGRPSAADVVRAR